ncbi:carboxypeptidase-like regulatory domain-containing protein [uncultured Methanobrevibacter sp.]|uniref:carboxypeptidase-like regulatory domain-containing protein n=1 Tax=uncultured Methanobrevibacter sp. TaxID=253161 RepID=UPI0025EC6C08|nr:carboxypeptidase-like regulatory domain-containing protein [uncultured Methanobrevibacter sp.]
MDSEKIIIILLGVIVILLVAAFVLFGPFAGKDVTMSMTTADTLYDGDYYGISLKGSDGSPIANATVNVTIIDSGGGRNPQLIVTDEKGEGQMQMNGLTPAQYTVELSYGGGNGYKANKTNTTIEMKAATTSSNSGASSGGKTVTLELPAFDNKYSTTVGEYRIEAMKWTGASVGGLGVWVYKNGQPLSKSSYMSRGYVHMDGNWKWTEWGQGGSGSNSYHKYPVSNGVEIQKVEVSF